jgi:hypothetical protein
VVESKAQYSHAGYIGTVPVVQVTGIYQNPDFRDEVKIRALDGLIGDASLAENMTKQQASSVNNTNAKVSTHAL